MKKGLSEIVATVLMLVIVIAMIGVVWVWVVPLFRENLQSSQLCQETGLSIGSSSGYTCYDSEKEMMLVQVKKSSNNVSIDTLKLSLTIDGNSISFEKKEDINVNSAKTYYLNNSGNDAPQKVNLAPILQIGDSTEECGIVSSVDVLSCTISSDIDETKVIQVTNRGSGSGGDSGDSGGDETPIGLTECGVLDKAGKTYELQSFTIRDPGNCLEIKADNIVLDGNHKELVGAGPGYGVYANGRNNVTIKNLNLSNFYNGIRFESTENSHIGGVSINSSNVAGIFLESSNSNFIENLVLEDNFYGIELESSNSNTFTNIVASSNAGDGVYLFNSDSNTFTNIVASSNNEDGIYIDGNSIELIDVTASNNGWRGVYSAGDSNTFKNIVASSNNEDGVYLFNSDSNTFTNIFANDNLENGITIFNSSNYSLAIVNANRNNYHGINLVSSSGVWISDGQSGLEVEFLLCDNGADSVELYDLFCDSVQGLNVNVVADTVSVACGPLSKYHC